MSEALKTKNVFITGGAQGLGKGYINALLGAGAKVVFGDIDPTIGAATEKEFQEKYGKDVVKFIAFDVTDGAKFEEAFQDAVKHLGFVDLMINNAGIMQEHVWEKMIQLNYTGVVRGAMMACEHMRKDKGGKGGRIINISSIFGLEDSFVVPIYCGTKHAVRSFTSSLAIAPDVKAQGVEYGVMCPGPAATDLVFKMDSERCRYMNLVKPEAVKAMTSPVERIVEGLMKLVMLEDMNGAILHANLQEITFYKMEKVNLGETFPPTPVPPPESSETKQE